MYLSSASLSKLGNLELSPVREEKYKHKEAQCHMNHVTHHKICSFSMRIQRKELPFIWGGIKGAALFKGLVQNTHLVHILNVELEKCFIENVEFELDPKVQMRFGSVKIQKGILGKGKA